VVRLGYIESNCKSSNSTFGKYDEAKHKCYVMDGHYSGGTVQVLTLLPKIGEVGKEIKWMLNNP